MSSFYSFSWFERLIILITVLFLFFLIFVSIFMFLLFFTVPLTMLIAMFLTVFIIMFLLSFMFLMSTTMVLLFLIFLVSRCLVFNNNNIIFACNIFYKDIHIFHESSILEIVNKIIFCYVRCKSILIKLNYSHYVPDIAWWTSIPFFVEFLLQHSAKLYTESIDHSAIIIQKNSIILHEIFIRKSLKKLYFSCTIHINIL